MNDEEFDEKEFDDCYRKQTEISIFISTTLLLIFIVLSLILCKSTFDRNKFQQLHNSYEILATIESIERHGEEFSMTVDGIYDGQVEVHTFAIDRDQFIHYKQGEEIRIRIKNNHCYIIEQ